MMLRELLQTEIWSKRTTRKLQVWTGTVLVIVGFWMWISHDWLTPPERKAGRVALEKIDALEHADGLTKEQFDTKFAEARAALDTAQSRAWTTRDRAVVELLSLSLDLEKSNRQNEEIVAKYPEYQSRLNGNVAFARSVVIMTTHELHALLYD